MKVKILGSGGAATKHKAAYAELSDLYEVTKSDDYDVLDICTPPFMHFRDIVSSERNIIIEKPICGSLYEIDKLTSRPGRICPIFQYRFGGHEPVKHEIATSWERHPPYYEGWRGQWYGSMGGCLASHSIHAFDLFIQKYGMPISVKTDIRFGEPNVEIESHTQLWWHDNFARVLTVLGPLQQEGFRFGEGGYVNQFRLVHKALTLGESLPVTVGEARQSLEVLTACYYSAYTNEPVKLPLGHDHPFYRGWVPTLARHALRRIQHNQSSQKISV